MVGPCGRVAFERSQSGGLYRTHGLSLVSFGYWRRKLANEETAWAPAVLPIRVASAAPPGLELSLPGGIVLRVSAADPVWLATLLRAVSVC
jgi:hypothetical protein